MPDKETAWCLVISEDWVRLNPHVQVHGCFIDEDETVHLYCWYRFTDSADGNPKVVPLELTIGQTARDVHRVLQNAVRTNNLTKTRDFSKEKDTSRDTGEKPNTDNDKDT